MSNADGLAKDGGSRPSVELAVELAALFFTFTPRDRVAAESQLCKGFSNQLRLQFLMFLIVAATTGAIPTWYLANRVHAHTRLRIKDYCHNGTGAWACEPLFEHAGERL